MRKNLSTIILILIFLVGLSVMLYPSVSDAVNRKHQSRAVAGYAEKVEQLSEIIRPISMLPMRTTGS